MNAFVHFKKSAESKSRTRTESEFMIGDSKFIWVLVAIVMLTLGPKLSLASIMAALKWVAAAVGR